MSLQSFRAVRWMRTFNLVLQAALFLTLIGGLNYLALHHSWRFDLTAHRRHSLSPETLAYVSALQQPVQLIVTIDRDASDPELAQAYRDVHGLLREYVTATAGSNSGRITMRHLDVYQHRRDAELLGIDRPNVVLALSGDRRRMIGLEEFYIVRGGTKQAFSGEQAVTAAILDVSHPVRPRVYFATGHGEMNPDEVEGRRGLSVFADELRLRNFEVASLNLAQTRRIPDDAALIVIAGPIQGQYQPFEEGLLRHYLSEQAGRVLLLLPPAANAGLEDLLYDWGVRADDVYIFESDRAHVSESGDLIISHFHPHPITQVLIDYGIGLVFGSARVVRPDPGRTLDESLQITVLAATSPTAWGARDYRLRTSSRYDPAVDLKGQPHLEPRDRLGVAVASERLAPPKTLPFSVRGGRLVVFGSADFASNNRISTAGNLAALLGAVDWCVDREVRLNTPPRPIERYQLNLPQQDVVRLRYSLLLVLPSVAALLGLIVYWTRRT